MTLPETASPRWAAAEGLPFPLGLTKIYPKGEILEAVPAEAMRVYGGAYNGDPEFYAFSRTLEEYKEGQNKNSVVILTTDSDYYRYLKQSGRTGTARPTS